ncbi:MAG: SDR family oxidoreductase [Acidimicrobiales bacterium]|nr:SDR family oxidoreductase [Acidimicrobiales bacterium]
MLQIDLSGKVAIVTGARAGIGAAIAAVLAEAGADVERHTGRSGERGADLADPGAVDGLISSVVAERGRLDILVNNAALQPVTPFDEIDPDEWKAVVDSGLSSVHFATQAAGRVMGSGSAVVNIASIEGIQPALSHSHYSTVKAAVIMHTRSAAAALGPAGIRVNCVSPGLIDRDGLAEAWPEGVTRYAEAAPLGRIGTAHDIGRAVAFLVSDLAGWITGSNLVVDGGVLATSTW